MSARAMMIAGAGSTEFGVLPPSGVAATAPAAAAPPMPDESVMKLEPVGAGSDSVLVACGMGSVATPADQQQVINELQSEVATLKKELADLKEQIAKLVQESAKK